MIDARLPPTGAAAMQAAEAVLTDDEAIEWRAWDNVLAIDVRRHP